MRSLITGAVAIVLVLAVPSGCGGRDEATPAPEPPGTNRDFGPGGRGLLAPEPTPGVRFRLADAEPAAADPDEAVPQAEATPLSESDVLRLVGRLPALPESAARPAAFALRPGPRPPAITGGTERQPFPPEATAGPPPEVARGPLDVVRHAPDGDVDVATQLAVTFSQPMVPLTSHAALAARDVPVRLDPLPAGSWRWVGSRTLIFEPEVRFPMATEYSVEVPAGARAEGGATLAAPVRWTFRTPPPGVVTFSPQGGPTTRQPVLVAVFDQRVDAEAVLARTTARAGGREVALRVAAAAEIAADEAARHVPDDAPAGRWVALRPAEALPAGAEVEVRFGPGLPSAEGPRTSAEAESFGFRVHGPLEVSRLGCQGAPDEVAGTRIGGCLPLGGWYARMSNPLADETFDPEAITVSPELPGLRVEVAGETISIGGLSAGRTKYRVTLPGTIGDVYGQALGQDVTLEFSTADAQPALFAPGEDIVVLDPAAGPALTVSTINNESLKVTLFRVGPEHFGWFQQLARGYAPDGPPPPAPEEAWSGTVQTNGGRDALAAVPIDLRPALVGDLGQVVVTVEPSRWSEKDESWQNRPRYRWVQVTRLGLDGFASAVETLAWVTSLEDGRPIGGAEVSIEPDGGRATTGADGLATLATASAQDRAAEPWWVQPLLVARRGEDVALVPTSNVGGQGDSLQWYLFDDRGIYKPGEAVHIKGWVRRIDWGVGGDVVALGAEGRIAYSLRAPNGEDMAQGTLDVDAFGGFGGAFDLPEDIELGYAELNLRLVSAPPDAAEYRHAINVGEFRRPEFEVKTTAEQPTAIFGERATVAVEASYFAGGPLPGAEVAWNVTAQPTGYTPPGRDDFVFGTWQPWWILESGPGFGGELSSQQYAGRTDAAGRHRLAIELDGVEPPSAVSFRAEASVQDVNRQAWTGSAALLVHPASLYVGLRTDRWFAEPGKPLVVEAIVADIDGALAEGVGLRLEAERLDWRQRGGDFVEDSDPAGECERTSAREPVSCTFAFETGGTYRLRAEIVDDEGRRNRSELTLWVAGGAPRPADRSLEGEAAQLVPDADSYQPGDTAEVLVQAPFAPAEGLLSIRRGGLVRVERFRMDGPSTTLRVPILEAHIPDVTVQVDLLGAAPRGDEPDAPPRPAFASGSIQLPVPPLARTLAVAAVPRAAALEPGGRTTVDITVVDAAGQPVDGAQVALVVVDEAVLALTAHQIPDPIATFYPTRWPGVEDAHQRRYVELEDPASLAREANGSLPMLTGGASGDTADMLAAPMAVPMEMDEEGLSRQSAMATAAPTVPPPGAPEVVAERTDLDPLAAFVPGLVTDADGRASAEVELPDNVTRYRITAVATDGAKRFGKGESTLTARLPLVVRPSAPRFLNFGDTFELPVVVQNQTGEALDVDVVVRAANLRLTAGAGRHVRVPAGDRVEVRFPAAAELPGTAVFQAGAFGGGAGDAQRVLLPVWTPATTEAFATYGEVDAGAIAQPVARPPDVVEGFGGLELTTSSTALSALTDAFLYLQTYPFDGAEQVASRLLATVALEDVLAAFGAEGLPPAAEVKASVRRDLDRLAALQNPDGGFGWWRADGESSAFLSVHVAHALARAQQKSYALDEGLLERTRAYLTEIRAHLAEHDIAGEAADAIEAYALFVRKLLGETDLERARALAGEAHEPSVETLGWLLAVLTGDEASARPLGEIRRQLANRASEEAGTAQFTTAYDEADGAVVLASDRRADAVVLEALILDDPDSDLIPKVARGLLAHRTKGRWGSTQENAWVLVALDRYFRTFEAQTPDFVARAWLGDGYLGEATFQGRETGRSLVEVPLALLPDDGAVDVVLAKDGPGRLYYRLGLRYAPADLALGPAEHGLGVERAYEPVDDPADVRRTADGAWQVRAGARVRVRLRMVAPARRYHVALVDPLPAGLEAQDPDLAVAGGPPPGGDEGPRPLGRGPGASSRWWPWTWFDHQAFRDERVESFAALVDAGVYETAYIARATTPGAFVAPPARAAELYAPETFGRSATDRVIVR